MYLSVDLVISGSFSIHCIPSSWQMIKYDAPPWRLLSLMTDGYFRFLFSRAKSRVRDFPLFLFFSFFLHRDFFNQVFLCFSWSNRLPIHVYVKEHIRLVYGFFVAREGNFLAFLFSFLAIRRKDRAIVSQRAIATNNQATGWHKTDCLVGLALLI